MKRNFKLITDHPYDVIVLGGGIIGSGIARDASLRGLDTLLIEKEDFGSGTTSRSTRLIHGGLRYLRQLEFGLVRQDLKEREVLLHIAPHLVHPISFIIPVHSAFLNASMALGVALYDAISFNKTLPNHQYLTRKQTLMQEPGLRVKNLQGSYIYYDCQIPYAERLNLENVLSADLAKATIINHARITNIITHGNRVIGVEVQDQLTGEIAQAHGKIVVNAAGHWVDAVSKLVFKKQPDYLRRTKGIHIVIPEVSKHALVLFSPVDGRLFFIIPWEGSSLVGTTDTDFHGDLDNVHATREDVDYVLRGLHIAYPDISIEDIFYTYAGLRSLVLKHGKSASDTSRNHVLIDHARRDELEGLVTVLGGKITAYRAVAKDATDIICRKLGKKAKCSTNYDALPGTPSLTEKEIQSLAVHYSISTESAKNLASLYGSRSREVLNMTNEDPAGRLPVSPGGTDIIAQIWHAVHMESCMTITDFMLRRSAIGLRKDQGTDAVSTVAREMKGILHWSEAEERLQIEEYSRATSLGRRYKISDAK